WRGRRHFLEPLAIGCPGLEDGAGAGTAGLVEVLLDELAQHTLVHRIEAADCAHFEVAARFEDTALVEHVGDAVRHAGREVATYPRAAHRSGACPRGPSRPPRPGVAGVGAVGTRTLARAAAEAEAQGLTRPPATMHARDVAGDARANGQVMIPDRDHARGRVLP